MSKAHPPTFLMSLLFRSLKQATQLCRRCLPTGMFLSFLLLSACDANAVNCNEVRAKYQCPVQKHRLHLSFDDGVGSVTDKVLDVLKRENIKATFFVMGNKIDCAKYPAGQSLNLCKQRVATLERIKREGHDIGSHGQEHFRHTQVPVSQMTYSIKKSKQLLMPYFTTQPPIFRLPNGDGWFNQKDKPLVMQTLKREGFEHIGWEMTAYDWNEKFQSGDQILDNVMGQMCGNGKRGRDGVVLFHDGVHENEHEGRLFTANNLARWIPSMRCAADFQPLLHFKKNLKKR